MHRPPFLTAWKPLSCNRSLVLDLIALAPREALYPLEQTFSLAQVAALRANAIRRISWPVLFIKAYAMVASRHAQLRQAYRPWPWPHLVQQPENVAMLVVNRQFEGEDRVCWGRFIRPEETPLAELQKALDAYQTEPVETIFRRQVRFSRCPAIIRRAFWRLTLHFSSKRAKRLGTFSLSTLAGEGTINRFHQTLLTTSLSYGALDENGRALVSLICDHRVFDGALGARILKELESVLNGAIADELRGLQRARRAA